jgi:hypothetical protein
VSLSNEEGKTMKAYFEYLDELQVSGVTHHSALMDELRAASWSFAARPLRQLE